MKEKKLTPAKPKKKAKTGNMLRTELIAKKGANNQFTEY